MVRILTHHTHIKTNNVPFTTKTWKGELYNVVCEPGRQVVLGTMHTHPGGGVIVKLGNQTPTRVEMSKTTKWVSEYWLLNVTIYNISVLHVTAHRCTGVLKLNLRPGSHAIDISQGSLPIQASTGATFLRLFRESTPISVTFYDTHGNTEELFSPKTPGSPWGVIKTIKIKVIRTMRPFYVLHVANIFSIQEEKRKAVSSRE